MPRGVPFLTSRKGVSTKEHIALVQKIQARKQLTEQIAGRLLDDILGQDAGVFSGDAPIHLYFDQGEWRNGQETGLGWLSKKQKRDTH